MAGGKETPRQRMIGMMYLVLTALLALNVSSAVLEKFAIINETLEDLVGDNSESNEGLLTAIQGSSVKSPEVDAAKETAKKIRELTKKTMVFMDDVKKKMRTEKDGQPIPLEELPQNITRSEELMLDESGSGHSLGTVYKNTLDSYVTDLNKLMNPKKPFLPITKTAGGYSMFKDAKSELKKQPYTAFAFHGTPTMGAIAYVSQQETEILEYEKKALSDLLALTKGTVYEVDQLVPMVRAEANTLVAGQTYEGQLFVAGAASGVDPQMFMGSTPVKVEEQQIAPGVKIKMGRVSFKAGATDYDPKTGIAQKSYEVRINLPGHDPLVQTIKYNVVKPKATFSSVASSTLYMECGNIKDVSIQGLTEVSGLSLSCPSDQGKIMKLGTGKFALIPKRPQMDVTITMDGVAIGKEKFFAKPVPEPQAILKANGQPVDKVKGIPLGVTRVTYDLRIPDDTFVAENRQDAGYRVSHMVVFTPSGPKPLNNNVINLSDLGLRAGQTFTISQVTVVRSTYDPAVQDDLPVNCKLGDTYQLATK